MKIAHVPVGSILLDALSLAMITPAEAKLIKSIGVDGVIGYLGPMTVDALAVILNAGLGFIPVNLCNHEEGWIPTDEMGQAEGSKSVNQARSLGLLNGISNYNDLEAMSGTAEDTIAYCEAWCKAAVVDGDIPSSYVGAGIPVNAEQLYQLPYEGYWHSCSEVPNVEICGYQMIQLYPPNQKTFRGITLPFEVDINIVQQDKKGRTPVWQIL